MGSSLTTRYAHSNNRVHHFKKQNGKLAKKRPTLSNRSLGVSVLGEHPPLPTIPPSGGGILMC